MDCDYVQKFSHVGDIYSIWTGEKIPGHIKSIAMKLTMQKQKICIVLQVITTNITALKSKLFLLNMHCLIKVPQ